MNRRELLKATAGVLVGNKLAMLGFDLKSSARHVIFFDPKLMHSDFPERALKPVVLPDGRIFPGLPTDTIFYPVEVPKGQTLDDAIRIYTES